MFFVKHPQFVARCHDGTKVLRRRESGVRKEKENGRRIGNGVGMRKEKENGRRMENGVGMKEKENGRRMENGVRMMRKEKENGRRMKNGVGVRKEKENVRRRKQPSYRMMMVLMVHILSRLVMVLSLMCLSLLVCLMTVTTIGDIGKHHKDGSLTKIVHQYHHCLILQCLQCFSLRFTKVKFSNWKA